MKNFYVLIVKLNNKNKIKNIYFNKVIEFKINRNVFKLISDSSLYCGVCLSSGN